MNKIITIIMILFIISCGNKGLATDPQKVETGEFYILKLKTLLYEDGIGVANSYPADDLVQISLGIGGEELEQKLITALNEGIKIPTDSKVTIAILPANEDEEIEVLWLGSSLEEDYWNSKEIELDINANTSITLVVSKDGDSITPSFIYLGVRGSGLGGRVLVNDNVYGEGEHEILSLSGLKASFEALLPEDDVDGNIEFLAFDSHMGRETSKTMDITVSGDTAVTATFYNKNDIKGTITISLEEKYIDSVTIKINGAPIVEGQYSLDNGLYNYTMEPQPVGTEIILTAETDDKDIAVFVSWTDDVSGYLGNQASDYKYTITEDATITPVFSSAEGVLTVTINPKTNWVDHRMNQVQYTIKRSGVADIVSSADISATHKNLTHNNNIISGIQAGDIVELRAIPGEGFYPDDTAGTHIKWSGAASGTGGITKTITFNTAASKSQVIDFKREDRTVIVSIDKYKTVSASGGDYRVKEASTNDAAGYSIIINGTTYNSSVANAVFPWHTKVKVEIKPGTHYTERVIYNGSSGETINPTTGYTGAENNNKTILTYDLENNVTNLVELDHKTVEMTQIIKGGSFGDLSAAGYIAGVNITGTGDNTTEGRHSASNYSKDGLTFSAGTSAQDSTQTFKVLSGVRVNIAAITTAATTFVNHSISANASYISSTSSTTPTASVSNNGNSFTVTTTFKSPTYELTVKPRAYTNATATATESDDLKATQYKYKTSRANTEYDSEQKFTLTNGIPVTLTAIPNVDYDVLSLGGVKDITEKSIVLSNNASTNVDFLHKMVKNKLVITGGKDDKHISYVEVLGTGLSPNTTKYEAKYRNMIYDGSIHKLDLKTEYEFYALAGIKNKLTITAVTSPVHNFHKIISKNSTVPFKNGGNNGLDIVEGVYKPGKRTYKSTNSNIVTEVRSDDNGVIDVDFRINSLFGSLNGIDEEIKNHQPGTTDDDKSIFDNNNSLAPPTLIIKDKIIIIYDAYDLYTIATDTGNTYGYNSGYQGFTINLSNDIYLGENAIFKGFNQPSTFAAKAFNGNGFVIYDPKLEDSFIRNAGSTQVKGITLARGLINARLDESGVFGRVTSSRIEYITNATRFTGGNGKNSVGGIIGYNNGGNAIQYLINYSHVSGGARVGGVIGYSPEQSGIDNKYFANYGNVEGRREVGGVIGYIEGIGNHDKNWDNPSGETLHYYLLNKGNIYASEELAGGILGHAGWGRFKIFNSYNTGEVKAGSRAGGIAGMVRGYRDVDDGSGDEDKDLDPFHNGYNIGKVLGSETGAIVSRAGYRVDGGRHNIYINHVYSDRALASTGKYIYSGIPYRYYPGDGTPTGTTYENPTYSYFSSSRGTVCGDNPEGVNNVLGITTTQLTTGLSGFGDANVWVQSAMPNINGYTARPTFKNLPETPKPTLDN